MRGRDGGCGLYKEEITRTMSLVTNAGSLLMPLVPYARGTVKRCQQVNGRGLWSKNRKREKDNSPQFPRRLRPMTACAGGTTHTNPTLPG
jgi:hypothetical protein